MNLIECTDRLRKIFDMHPELAVHDMIVRNVQGPEENQPSPYDLGRIVRIDADKYVCSDRCVYFASDCHPVETAKMQRVITDVMWEPINDWKQPDPYELPDDDVRKMYDALPWKDAVVVDIGVRIKG